MISKLFHGQIRGQKSYEREMRSPMARHGENIRKRKDGRWEGRFPVYDKEKGKTVYRSVYAHSYQEVRTKVDVQKRLLQCSSKNTGTEGLILPREISFSMMAQEWLAEIKSERKPSTYVKYSTIYQKHISQSFQELKVSDITEGVVAERISDPLSDSVRKSIYCVLNQVLRYTSERYSTSVPILKKPVSSIRKKAVKVISHSGQRALVKTLYQEMDIFKMAVLVCMGTGLRLGEICALKWADIDFENRLLTVSRTVQRLSVAGQKNKTALVETTPKSGSSQREIPLSDAVLKLFMSFRNGKEYIFGGDKPLEPRTLQYHFKRILEEAGLENKNFHILRHTFATNCIEGGMDVKSLSEILGHSDVQITLRLYVHPSMDTKRKGMDQIAQFYEQIRGQFQGQAG